MKRLHCGYDNRGVVGFCAGCDHSLVEPVPETRPPSVEPNSFGDGRYRVNKCLGEGANRKIYPVHHTVFDRDVASAPNNTRKLDGTLQTNNRHLQKPVLLTRYSGHLREPDHA